MKTSLGFATHGETLKLLYEAFGVLPRKEARFDDFDETDKKTLQKQLARLASEEGNLVENYKKAITAFSQLMAKYLQEQGQSDALSMMIEEIDQIYAEMIRAEGTYLDKSESLRYFISIKAIPTFVMVLNRSKLRLSINKAKGISADDMFWYLPTWEPDGRLTMPLAKVVRRAYAACGASQKQFHSPGRITDPTEPAKQQNLDNAINWIRGKTLPSLPALITNFKESFAALSDYNRAVELDTQKSILTSLVYARVATFIAQLIQDAYGTPYLEDVCRQIRQITQFLQEEVQEFKGQIVPIVARQFTDEQARFIWFNASKDHEYFVRDKLNRVQAKLLELYKERPYQPFRAEVLDALVSKFGNFAVYANTDSLRRLAAFTPPTGFQEMLSSGFDIKGQPETSLEQIDEFEERLAKLTLQNTLCWLPPWLRGVYYYRREDFAAAFPHYELAFEQAKYRAGRYQYKLVNQFVELAAKNDKTILFKKGVDWATYIGLKIRWLRDKEPTQENLDFVRYMMKVANYSHQL